MSVRNIREKIQVENSLKNLEQGLNSDIGKTIEDIITNSGVAFMTTSLTYTRDSIEKSVKDLKYCTLGDDEQAFIIYDERPLLHRGEYGFCITNERIIVNPELSKKYEISIDDMGYFDKKGFLSSKIVVKTRTAKLYEINVSNLSDLTTFVTCLNKVVSEIPKNKKEVEDREHILDKKIAEASLRCIEENNLLIEYFGVYEKVENIRKEAEKYQPSIKKLDKEKDVKNDNTSRKAVKAKETVSSADGSQVNNLAEIHEEEPLLEEKTVESSEQPQPATEEISTGVSKLKSELQLLEKGFGNLTETELSVAMVAFVRVNPIIGLCAYGTDIFKKKLPKAKKAYALSLNETSEKPLVLFDSTIFESAKTGFVVTTRNLFINIPECKNTCVKIEDITKFSTAQLGGSNYVCANTNLGKYYVRCCSSEFDIEFTIKMLTSLVEYIKKETHSIEDSKKLNAQSHEWTCTCGAVNTTKFCPNCGKPQENN